MTAKDNSVRPYGLADQFANNSAIRIPKTAEVVANMIRKRIIRGELQANDFLPPESQLMTTLGISRPTLREAFRILESEMLISVVRGSRTGARVHAPRVDTVSRYAAFVLQSQNTTIGDIYQARLAIEPFVVRRLAEKPTDAIVQRLNSEIERLNFLVDESRYADFMMGLAEFHRVLVELGNNNTLLLITTILQGMVARHQVNFLQNHQVPVAELRERSLWGLRSFRKLVNLIEASDADRAEAHWLLHLRNANRAWADTDASQKTIDTLD